MSPEEVAATAVESAVLGPDDVLVVVVDQVISRAEFERLADGIVGRHAGLKDRVLVIANAKVLVARGAAKAVDL